jgi:hypothetical protein
MRSTLVPTVVSDPYGMEPQATRIVMRNLREHPLWTLNRRRGNAGSKWAEARHEHNVGTLSAILASKKSGMNSLSASPRVPDVASSPKGFLAL